MDTEGSIIVASAVRLADGRVFVGKRHGDCFNSIIAIYERMGMGWDKSRWLHIGSTQGFVTDRLEFLSREDALEVAVAAGQCPPKKAPPAFCPGLEIQHRAILMSEDLW